MAITSYPRITVQGTGKNLNPQNGQALMIFNAVTNKYEAATATTFAGLSDATAANQLIQISEAQLTNTKLDTVITVLNSILATVITTSITDTIILAAGANPLPAAICKLVTIYNNSISAISVNHSSPTDISIDAGYSVDIYTTDASNITITGTAGASIGYVIYN